jgi:hypothetical protein
MNTATFEATVEQSAGLQAFGMPGDRLAHMAARRAFVEMKTCFMRAAADIDGTTGALLQRKVRLASEVIELWRLRHALLTALPRDQATDMHRRELRRHLDSAFPESITALTPL